MNKEIRVVELFAGVGGFKVALNNSIGNYNTIYSNQWEPSSKVQFAFNALQKNFPDSIISNEDIKFAKKTLPKDFDLLVGGFPCQDYSVAATKTKGIEGKKGVLWWEISSILKKNKPSYILLENVDRLLKSPSSQRGRDFSIILKDLDLLGYNVEWMVINAADYGFVQRRKRIFIIAWRKNSKLIKLSLKEDITKTYKNGFFVQEFSSEFISHKANNLDLNKYTDLLDVSNNYSEGKLLNYGMMIKGKIQTSDYNSIYTGEKKYLKDILETNVSDNYFVSKEQEEKIKYLKGHKRILRKKPNGENYFYSEGAMSLNDFLEKPARTMLTSESTINRSSHFIYDFDSKGRKRLRKITPIEAERINGFPDNWTADVMSERQRYFCMGNALVIPLVTKISDAIFKKIS